MMKAYVSVERFDVNDVVTTSTVIASCNEPGLLVEECPFE